MFYEDEDIIKSDIFDKLTTKKIKLFAVVKGNCDEFIDLHFYSHGVYYVLSHYNNYPSQPFVEIEEFKNINELDFHTKTNCTYYKIPAKDQVLDFLTKDKFGIHSNLFDLTFKTFDIKDVLNGKESNLLIDEKYKINENDYYNVAKEFTPSRVKNISIER